MEGTAESSFSELMQSRMRSNMQDFSASLQASRATDNINGDDDIDETSTQLLALNSLMKRNFMSYCSAFVQEEDARDCVQLVWNKYLQCVGDVAMMAAFFDTLPFHVKLSVLPKYQNEIVDWCQNLFRIRCDALLYATNQSEAFLRVIRCALKLSHSGTDNATKQAIIYVSIDFDPSIKSDVLSGLSNIQFEHCRNDPIFEDMIDANQLDELVKRDVNDSLSYPLMVVANAGTTLLGRCDELSKIKQLCHRNNLWLHVTGDLLGSLALLSTVKESVSISGDSLTMDAVKLLGIQNLPYLTFFNRPIAEITQTRSAKGNTTVDDRLGHDHASTALTANTLVATTTASTSVYDDILASPSIGFLSIWSISQRCSRATLLYHMKRSFDLTALFTQRLKQMKTIRVLNYDDRTEMMNYKQICSGDVPADPLPKTVILFRFETSDIPDIESLDDLHGYTDLLNLWLFDKLCQQYPKMNLELLKSIHFQMVKTGDDNLERTPAHTIRFAPLEHLLDTIDDHDMLAFLDDMQRYSDILVATMTARARLPLIVGKYENLISIPMPNWAGIGAVQYVPDQSNTGDSSDKRESVSYDMNTIQAELARKLQANDSAFSLGGGTHELDGMFYLRLGMIRKRDDLDVLLQKVANAGKETEISLRYVEDMADKIRSGINKVQKDLRDENQHMLAQEGLLRQVPLISNIMSWWSPSPSASPLATKGRSFDLNSGRVESTEDTYVYRMQIKKQSPHAPTHNEEETSTSTAGTDTLASVTDDQLAPSNQA